MEPRTLSNPEVSKMAGVLVQRIEVELRGLMLGNDDAALVLLAAAHGRARAANWTRDGLVNRAAMVWESCEEGREPMRTSLTSTSVISPCDFFSTRTASKKATQNESPRLLEQQQPRGTRPERKPRRISRPERLRDDFETGRPRWSAAEPVAELRP